MTDNLPDKLYECTCEVVVVHKGNALVSMQNGRMSFCSSTVSQGKNLQCGDKVQINARLVPQGIVLEKVPYLSRAIWFLEETVPVLLFPRMLEPLAQDELSIYSASTKILMKMIPTEMEKFLGNTDYESLGSLLAMQGIIEEIPLEKKPTMETNTSASSTESETTVKEKKSKKKRRKKKETKKKDKGKKDKKKKKEKKNKDEKKAKKRKHKYTDEEDESKTRKRKRSSEDEHIPHHLVLHKLNDMINELERNVKPSQDESKSAAQTEKSQENVIAYPKIGVAYDPNQINAWSNLRGFQNSAQVLQKSSWLGLTVAPSAVPTIQAQEIINEDEKRKTPDSSDSETDTPRKLSVFQDIFCEERPPSPEQIEDEVPSQAFFRRSMSDTTNPTVQKPKIRSSNLSKALQSRLKKKKSTLEEQRRQSDHRYRGESSVNDECEKYPTKERKEKYKIDDKYEKSKLARKNEEKSSDNKDRLKDKRSPHQDYYYDEQPRSRSTNSKRIKHRKAKKDSKPGNKMKNKKRNSHSDSGGENSSEDVAKGEERNIKLEKRLKKRSGSGEAAKFIESDQENEQIMIDKIRSKRAKLIAKLPAPREPILDTESLNAFEKSSAKDDREPITYFHQSLVETPEEIKNFKTILLCGSVLHSGQFSQLFQLSSSVLGHSKSFFQCCFPELLSKSDGLTLGSRNEVMDTLQLKSSKFDVSKEGMRNVCYKHSSLGTSKTVSEKELLIEYLGFLQSLNEPVVLFLHYKDSLLPTLLAKLNKYKLFDHFCNLVSYCCDIVGLAWSLRMDHLWSGKQYPSLRIIATNRESRIESDISTENAPCVLADVLGRLMSSNHLHMQKVMEMSNKMNIVEYVSVKYSMIQSVKVEEGGSLPDFLELLHSHEAWGVRTRVDLVWSSLEGITKMLRAEKSPMPQKRLTPLPIPENHDGEDQVTILKQQTNPEKKTSLKLKARQFIDDLSISWESKKYNAFLSPGIFTIPENSNLTLELRVPALQLRIDHLLGERALIEGTEDFKHCEIKERVSKIEQSDTSLFPFVKVDFRNKNSIPVQLSSEMISYPVATVKLVKK